MSIVQLYNEALDINAEELQHIFLKNITISQLTTFERSTTKVYLYCIAVYRYDKRSKSKRSHGYSAF